MTPRSRRTGSGNGTATRWALRDCTLTIPERAVVGLAGPNGAGKSTLLGLAAGLLGRRRARISVLGARPGGSERARDVGYVAEDAPLYRSFTVGETSSSRAAPTGAGTVQSSATV